MSRLHTYSVVLIWGLVAFIVIQGLLVGAMLLSTGDVDIAFTLSLAFIPIVGAVVLTRRPANRIGLLMLSTGVVAVTGSFLDSYVRFSLHHDGWPAVEWAAWLSSWTVWGPLECYLVFMLLLFPTGQFMSSRWRIVAVSIVFITLVQATIDIFHPRPYEDFGGDVELQNPVAIDAFGAVSDTAIPITDLLLLLTIVAAVAATVVRFRRSRGIERQQLKWFVFVAVAIILLIALMIAAPNSLLQTVFGVAFLFGASVGLPIAMGVAVLRYRLYDIDQIINRTIVYGLLSATLLGLYLAIVLGLGEFLQAVTGRSSQLVVAVSTLAVAALFQPLRSRIQRVVDHRFYRSTYDIAVTLEAFSARLREQVDLNSLHAELQSVVVETMQPEHVTLWLRTSLPHTRSREG